MGGTRIGAEGPADWMGDWSWGLSGRMGGTEPGACGLVGGTRIGAESPWILMARGSELPAVRYER